MGTSSLHRRLSLLARLAAATAASLGAAAAFAAQSLGIVVPFGPGSGADSLARQCAPALQAALGGPVEVQNITGSTGIQGIRRLLEAPADGRTMAVLTADTFATLAYTNPRWSGSDLVPVAIMMRQPSMLFVPMSSRFARWQDMEKEARAAPRTLRVAVTGFGSPDYIALQQLAARKIQLTPVPLPSPQDRVQAVVRGEADAIYEQLGDMRPFVDAGQFRPILAFGAMPPMPGMPAVPNAKDLGLGEPVAQFRAFVVKRGTDPQTVSALASTLERVAMSPEYRAFLQKHQALGDSFVPAQGARAFLDRELAQMKKIVQSLPMHSQYLFDEGEAQDLPPQF